MFDVLKARNIALDQLFAEFHQPPPIPPKSIARRLVLAKSGIAEALPTPDLPKNIWACLDAPSRPKDELYQHGRTEAPTLSTTTSPILISSFSDTSSTTESTYSRSTGRDSAGPQVLTVKLAFAQDDSDLLTLPVVQPNRESCDEDFGKFELSLEQSIFDPLLEPRPSHLPEHLLKLSKRKPKPLDLNRQTPQLGKWRVNKESDISTPIGDKRVTAAMMPFEAMPELCPIQSPMTVPFPGQERLSIVKARENGHSHSMKLPAVSKPESPAHIQTRVRFEETELPATSKFVIPPTPFSFPERREAASQGPERSVRFENTQSPATSKFDMPLTPYHLSEAQKSSSQTLQQTVRIDDVRSPVVQNFRAPPHYEDSFYNSPFIVARNSMIFEAEEASPAPLYEEPEEFSYSRQKWLYPSPKELSPITPEITHYIVPAIEPDTPQSRFSAFSDAEGLKPGYATVSLHSHLHQVHGPVQTTGNESATMRLAATFDETAVGEKTLEWLGAMSEKNSYHIRQSSASDRSQILGRYFHRTTTSI